ncbi:helix-turn-helix transcriptional regulator [Acidaminobacter sp.]|uniref:helix-turn-helix domain-containing protein n=1 Tax=Acidaminobacter sp. TaxID=1872102 RepID=UPI0027E39D69|nr:helix-turn-helix transcriptional regulator [Acidaminobacter sp.]
MDRLDVNERIRQLMIEKGWSEYKLAKSSNLSQSTISNIFKRNTVPSVSTIEAICFGFGISLSQFFAEDDLIELSEEQKKLFSKWVALTAEQKELLYNLIKNLK